MAVTMFFDAVLPRRAAEAIARLLGADQTLVAPNHAARAAYEARMVDTIDASAKPASEADAPQREAV
jgi:hypothetical protein